MGETKRKRTSTIIDGIEPYVVQPGEEYMNDAQREEYIFKDGFRDMKNEAANFPDEVDRASQEEEFALELRTRDRERKLIRKIEKTLSTIDSDDFGYCKNCGSEIGIRRLEARPTADLCVDCKELAEIKEKQLSD